MPSLFSEMMAATLSSQKNVPQSQIFLANTLKSPALFGQVVDFLRVSNLRPFSAKAALKR